MVKFGVEAFRQRRRIVIFVGAIICVLIPTPFILQFLDSLATQPIKNYTGIQVTWRSGMRIKVYYKKVSKIPIRIVASRRFPITYHTISTIKITYRDSNNSDVSNDPRFPIVRLRSTTFRVQPMQRQ